MDALIGEIASSASISTFIYSIDWILYAIGNNKAKKINAVKGRRSNEQYNL